MSQTQPMEVSAVTMEEADDDLDLEFDLAEDAELNALADARTDQAVIQVALDDL